MYWRELFLVSGDLTTGLTGPDTGFLTRTSDELETTAEFWVGTGDTCAFGTSVIVDIEAKGWGFGITGVVADFCSLG